MYRRGVWYGACSGFYFWAANPSRCFFLCMFTSLFYSLDCCLPFPPPSFVFLYVAHSLCLPLSSYLGCLALLTWLHFFCSLLRRIFVLALRVLYVIVLCVFRFCLSSVSWFSSWIPSWRRCLLQVTFAPATFCLLSSLFGDLTHRDASCVCIPHSFI